MREKLRCMTSIYLSKNNKMLLLYRQGSRVVNNLWIGSAGGHLEKEELNNPDECILRELNEELGIVEDDIKNFKLRYVILRKTKGEIRQNYFYFADLDRNIEKEIMSNEGISKWFDYSELETVEMPFSAKHVIKHYLRIGINNDKLYGGIADGEKLVFVEMPEF